MTVDDRVAFACTFLSDNKLNDYLKSLTMTLIDDGNLDGILLTGIYIHNTFRKNRPLCCLL